MLEYEWGNPASILLSGEDSAQDSDQTRQIMDPFNQTLTGNLFSPTVALPFHQQQQNQTFFDSRADAFSQSRPTVSSTPAPGGFSNHAPFQLVSSRNDEFPSNTSDFPARIGLNLGVRTYFASADEDFVNRLYRRSRPIEPANAPRCQAEGCAADLTHAKNYHRRHKVCDFHSKASTVIAAGLTQRFCQQCSRFHPLSEFDQGKRSCRKRLADHNRRRRKSKPQQQSQIENHTNSLAQEETRSRSSPESGTRSSSSVSVAASPPRITLDCFRSTHNGSVMACSSNSRFSPTKENFQRYEYGTMEEENQ